MRIWHKYLIKVLPKQQLLAQWRECALIKKNIDEEGTPNHLLVNKVMSFPLDHFFTYCHLIEEEMKRRGYKISYESQKKIYTQEWNPVAYNNLFKRWHETRYLVQCYYNLQEKYDCGGITKEEWKEIETVAKQYMG